MSDDIQQCICSQEGTYIGVNDINGTPIKNGSVVKSIIEDSDKEYLIFWDQEKCSFMMRQLHIPTTIIIGILNFILSKYFVVASHVIPTKQ